MLPVSHSSKSLFLRLFLLQIRRRVTDRGNNFAPKPRFWSHKGQSGVVGGYGRIRFASQALSGARDEQAAQDVRDGRSRLGRRVADLAEDLAQRLGGWASLSDTMIAQVRTNAFRDGNIDPIGLVRLGRTSARRGPLVETALAHVIGDKAEQAYRRSDALEKRRKLMEAWASYCEPKVNSNVLHLRKC